MYHSDVSRISKSGLDYIAKSPAHYWERYLNPNREPERKTDALVEGNAFHVLTLEADKFPHHFVIMPKFSGTGSVAKKDEFLQTNAEKSIITMDQYDKVRRMRDSVMKHPIASQLIAVGIAETTLKWEDPVTDAPCKCRKDWWNPSNQLIVDLKSTEDASEEGFAKSSFKYRYHVQGAFYLDGARANNLNPQGFVFIAVEKKPPYLVNVFYMPDDIIDFGRRIYVSDLQTYMNCRQANQWPGYDVQIKPLNLPSWVKM